jgi:hypothetical protein
MVLVGVLKLVETVTLYASTNPVFSCTVVVPRQILSFGACLFKLRMLSFMHYETMRLRADVDYLDNVTLYSTKLRNPTQMATMATALTLGIN